VINHSYSSAGNYTVTLTVKDNNGATDMYAYLIDPFIKGDFNGNGRVDLEDATYVAYMVVGKVPVDLSADFNGNGRVDIGDATKIAYYLVGKIDKL
ncbi:MAG: PKD domain-containing protein, partial [Methanosarcinales archaeon]